MDEFDARRASLDLVTAFVSNNTLTAGELPALLREVFAAISGFQTTTSSVAQQAGSTAADQIAEPTRDPVEKPVKVIAAGDHSIAPAMTAKAPEASKPAVSVRESLADPAVIVSLITGESFKTLKRHLTKHGLTEAEYKARFNLPDDYPTVAPAYAEVRRKIALARKGKVNGAKATADLTPDAATEALPAAQRSAKKTGLRPAQNAEQVDSVSKIARRSAQRRPSPASVPQVGPTAATVGLTGKPASDPVVAGSGPQPAAKASTVKSPRKRRMARPPAVEDQSGAPASPSRALPEPGALGAATPAGATPPGGGESSLTRSARKGRKKLSVKFG